MNERRCAKQLVKTNIYKSREFSMVRVCASPKVIKARFGMAVLFEGRGKI